METSINNCFELARSLGLKPESDGLFVGRVQGFPVALKIIDPEGATVLLFQIRHWLTESETKLKSLAYGSVLSPLLTSKDAEIEFEDRFAWFTINNLGKCLDAAPVSELLAAVLATFKGAGFIGDESLCHYCQTEKVESLTVLNGKVAQICAGCLAERQKKMEKETTSAAAESVPIALMSPGAALVGAILWSVCWGIYAAIFDHFNSEVIVVPRLLLGIVIAIIGLSVGGPVGWIIKQNRKRGRAVSTIASVFFSSLAVIAGEVLHLVWLIFREVHVISFSTAVRVMPDYYARSGVFFVSMKIVAAGIAVLFAYEISKPTKAVLKL